MVESFAFFNRRRSFALPERGDELISEGQGGDGGGGIGDAAAWGFRL